MFGNRIYLLGNFACLLSSADFFIIKINIFKKNMFQEYHQSIKQSGFSQSRRFVGPDLGPNCLQKLSADGLVGKDLIDIKTTRRQNNSATTVNSATLLVKVNIIVNDNYWGFKKCTEHCFQGRYGLGIC